MGRGKIGGFESAEVPFVKVGNRFGLTGLQIMTDDACADFYRRFKHCFEPGPVTMDVVLLIEPQDRAHG